MHTAKASEGIRLAMMDDVPLRSYVFDFTIREKGGLAWLRRTQTISSCRFVGSGRMTTQLSGPYILLQADSRI